MDRRNLSGKAAPQFGAAPAQMLVDGAWVDALSDARIQPWTLYSNLQRWGLLAVLFLVSTSNYLDRNIISVLLAPLKQEFHVSDTLLGLLSGSAFALFYATLGLPVARWADRGNRKTVIVLAIAVWSVATALCGLSQTFWQLAMLRIAVGAGEAGAIPPAQSLITDYFPPHRRALALAIFMAASSAGYLLGLVLGGQIAVHAGWRMAFLIAGAPGVVLALVCFIFLREPRTVLMAARSSVPETTGATLRALFRKRSFVLSVVGLTVYFFFAYGALVFVPVFLVRVLDIPLGTVSVGYGLVVTIAAASGNLIGGFVADYLASRDIGWLARLPAMTLAIACPVYVTAFAATSFAEFLVLGGMGFALLSIGLSPVFAAVQVVCGPQRRAVAVACLFFFANLFGLGLGPVLTGAISDLLTSAYGNAGLRYTLMVVPLVLLPTAWCFRRAAQSMADDREDRLEGEIAGAH